MTTEDSAVEAIRDALEFEGWEYEQETSFVGAGTRIYFTAPDKTRFEINIVPYYGTV